MHNQVDSTTLDSKENPSQGTVGEGAYVERVCGETTEAMALQNPKEPKSGS